MASIFVWSTSPFRDGLQKRRFYGRSKAALLTPTELLSLESTHSSLREKKD